MANVRRPAETVLIWETGKANWAVEMMGWRCNGNDPNGEDCPRCYGDWTPNHSGGRNLIFCDGHCKWYRDNQIDCANHYAMWDWRSQPE